MRSSWLRVFVLDDLLWWEPLESLLVSFGVTVCIGRTSRIFQLLPGQLHICLALKLRCQLVGAIICACHVWHQSIKKLAPLIVGKKLARKEVCGNTLDVNWVQVLVLHISHIHGNEILVAFLGILLLNFLTATIAALNLSSTWTTLVPIPRGRFGRSFALYFLANPCHQNNSNCDQVDQTSTK